MCISIYQSTLFALCILANLTICVVLLFFDFQLYGVTSSKYILYSHEVKEGIVLVFV